MAVTARARLAEVSALEALRLVASAMGRAVATVARVLKEEAMSVVEIAARAAAAMVATVELVREVAW